MPLLRRSKSLEYDWDPDKSVVVHNKTDRNILLDLPTGDFRLDARCSFRMTPDIAQVPQIQDLVNAGEIEIVQP